MPDPTPPVGYLLKHAQALLHARMEESLRPLGLGVSQYVCLHLLHERPGISASELARSAFVTRQSMNALLQGLRRRGLVERDDRAASGRALSATLTLAGAEVLRDAEVLVDGVETRMLSGLAPTTCRDLGSALTQCIQSLDAGAISPPTGGVPTP